MPLFDLKKELKKMGKKDSEERKPKIEEKYDVKKDVLGT